MKSVRKIILAAAAMLISLQAEAQKAPVKWVPMTPPLEYDYPYQGQLTLARGDARTMLEVCGTKQLAFFRVPIACNINYDWLNICHIYIADDEILKAEGQPYKEVLRHEEGHCNGWRDHTGARRIPAPRGKPPVLNKGS